MKSANWNLVCLLLILVLSGLNVYATERNSCKVSLQEHLLLDPTIDVTPIKQTNSHRFFTRITESQLREKLEQALKLITDNEYPSPDFTADMMQWSLELNPKVTADLSKVSFDTNELNIVGFKALENGFVYYGIIDMSAAGGETFYILYWDGHSVRGYIPVAGNLWNTKTKTPYGENGIIDIADLKKRFPKLVDRKLQEDDEAFEYFEELKLLVIN